MIKVILVITSSIDKTVDYVEGKYCGELDIYRVNVDQLPTYEITIANNGAKISDSYNKAIFLHEVDGILYRKPMFPDISEYDRAYHDMIQKDIIALINGMIDSFDGRVLTKPHILRKCENKIYQLIYASENNVLMPKSFIGNSRKELLGVKGQKNIIKPITTGKVYHEEYCELFQTSYFDGYQEDIALTPVYIQNYIEKKYEVRLTVVDNQFFGVKIIAGDLIDWRKSYESNQYSIIEVPIAIKKQVANMMKAFGLHFGAFDFIVSKDEQWYFLEVNPNGQWLWLEKELNLKISDAIVDYLCGGEVTDD